MIKEPIAELIWDIKYRYRQDGKVIDQSLTDTWWRVARAIASAEKPAERKRWEAAFYQQLADFKFLPGGRILAGAGTQHSVTLFNCFVMNIPEDSLRGIFTALQEGALTLQQGGGVGYDFSVLRPHGDNVKKIDAPASGPVSFMRIWDAMCSVMLSTGARRGAMMGVLRCDHPDIEEFISAKKDPGALRHFNVSVMVSDAFMNAVKQNEQWPLIFPSDNPAHQEIIYRPWGNSLTPVACRVYKRVRARKLWQDIIQSAYDAAEPGVLFADTINRMNTLSYRERLNATNPCGEIPLPVYGACNLGAVNLTQYVQMPFTTSAALNWQKLEETIRIATRFLDNVIDVSAYPLAEQREQALGSRRIGLGVTGLADVFVMMGMQYGSAESIKLTQDIMKCLAEVTWQTSIELAEEKGAFPFYQKEYVQSEFVRRLDGRLQHAIEKKGIRNSHHNTIAPAGTISLLANNVSNGIEPIFRPSYIRHLRTAEQDIQTFNVKDYAYHLWLHTNHSELPPSWIDANTLTPAAHLAIQAAAQTYVDNAISKTINIPRFFPFEDLADVYTSAYELGLKGCTIFRPNDITGNVLEEESKKQEPFEPCCRE